MRRPVVPAFLAVLALLPPSLSTASPPETGVETRSFVAEAHIGPLGAVHGDLSDDLDLGVGITGGVGIGYALDETFTLFARYDGFGIPGDVGRLDGIDVGGLGLSGLDADLLVSSLSFGAEVRTRDEALELYAGIYPGVTFTEVEVSGDLRIGDLSGTATVSTDTSVDVGLGARTGLRWYPTENLFLASELAYQLVLFRDELDDDVGFLAGTLGVGLRF